jgi:heme A synthase
LIGLAGLGLVAAGAFVTDACCGYPPGTPEGMASNPSVTGTIHDLTSMVVFFGLAIAMVVMARRFRGDGHGSRWAIYSRLSAVLSLAFLFAALAFPDVTGLLQRIAILLAFGWVAQVMWRFRTRDAVAG